MSKQQRQSQAAGPGPVDQIFTAKFKARMSQMILEAEERAAIAESQVQYLQQILTERDKEVADLRAALKEEDKPFIDPEVDPALADDPNEGVEVKDGPPVSRPTPKKKKKS